MMAAKERKKAVDLSMSMQLKCCRLLFPGSGEHVSVNYLKHLYVPAND